MSMCGVAWMKKAVPEKTKAAVLGVCTSLITAFACLTIFVITEATLDLRQVIGDLLNTLGNFQLPNQLWTACLLFGRYEKVCDCTFLLCTNSKIKVPK